MKPHPDSGFRYGCMFALGLSMVFFWMPLLVIVGLLLR